MTALDDRLRWLAHLRECVACPTDMCDLGMELAAAVRESMIPGESWEVVWCPKLGAR